MLASHNVDTQQESQESQEQANHDRPEVEDPAAEDAKKEQLRVWHVHEAGFKNAHSVEQNLAYRSHLTYRDFADSDFDLGQRITCDL